MNELRTAYCVRSLLDEGTENLSNDQVDRLGQARRRALDAMPARARPGKPAARSDADAPGWFARAALTAAPLALVAVGAFTLISLSDDQRIEEMAELDGAVLLDDLPLSAYADAGFGVFLKHTRQ